MKTSIFLSVIIPLSNGFTISIPTEYGKVNQIFKTQNSTGIWTTQNYNLHLNFDKNYSHVRGKWRDYSDSMKYWNGLFLDYPYFYGEYPENQSGGFSISCMNIEKQSPIYTIPRTSSWQILDTFHGGILRINEKIMIRLQSSTLYMEQYQLNHCIRKTTLNLSETLAPWIALARIDTETFLISNMKGDIFLIGMNMSGFHLEILKIIKCSLQSSFYRVMVSEHENGNPLLYCYPHSINGVEIITLQKIHTFMWRILQQQSILNALFRFPILKTIQDNYHYYILEESGILYKVHSITKEIHCSSWNQDRWIEDIHKLESGWLLIIFRDMKKRQVQQIKAIPL